MTYISLTRFRDSEDGHLYDEGEQFPFDGRKVPEKRLKELESNTNKAGFPLIKAEAEEQEPEK